MVNHWHKILSDSSSTRHQDYNYDGRVGKLESPSRTCGLKHRTLGMTQVSTSQNVTLASASTISRWYTSEACQVCGFARFCRVHFHALQQNVGDNEEAHVRIQGGSEHFEMRPLKQSCVVPTLVAQGAKMLWTCSDVGSVCCSELVLTCKRYPSRTSLERSVHVCLVVPCFDSCVQRRN